MDPVRPFKIGNMFRAFRLPKPKPPAQIKKLKNILKKILKLEIENINLQGIEHIQKDQYHTFES